MVGSVVLFDSYGHGHSIGLDPGLLRAAHGLGMSGHLFTAIDVGSVRDPVLHVHRLAALGERVVAGDPAARRQQKRAFRDAIALAADEQAAFVDLGGDLVLHSERRVPPLPEHSVFAIHRPPHRQSPTGLSRQVKATMRDPARARARRQHERLFAVTHQLVDRGAVVAVHTEAKRRQLAAQLPGADIRHAPWPSAHAADLPLPSGRATEVCALFAGSTRADKGLDVLVEALARVPAIDRLHVPSTDPATAAWLRSLDDTRLKVGSGPITVEEHHACFETAAFVVVPYTESFGAENVSAIVVDALAHGLPLVVTRTVAASFDPPPPGMVVVEHGVDALVAGLRRVVDDLDDMRAEAAVAGPALVAERHTYEAYLRTLLGLPG